MKVVPGYLEPFFIYLDFCDITKGDKSGLYGRWVLLFH